MRKKKAILLLIVSAILINKVNCLAANTEVSTAGGFADSAVPLSVEDTSGGIEELFSAYVPAELPIKMDLDGNVVVPSKAMIINGVNTRGIKVTDINVEMLNGWLPAAFTDDFSAKEVDSKEVALKLRNDFLQQDGSFNITEGDWNIAKQSYLPLNMDVKIPKQSTDGSKGEISNIQFTMDWSGDDSSVGPAVPTGSYTIDFEDALFGTIVDKTQILTDDYGTVISLPETIPDSGYILKKWVNVDTGFEVKIGDILEDNVTLRPYFVIDNSQNKVTITFTGINCEINGVNTIEVSKGTLFKDIAKPSCTETAGYVFDGYYTADNVYVMSNTIINSNMTINIRYNQIEVVDNAFYYGVSGGNVTINGINQYDLSATNGILRIPDEILGMPVVAIDNEAFQYETGIKQVIIPESVTELGDKAFYKCTNLRSLTSLGHLTTVDGGGMWSNSGVFYGCTSLETIDIKNAKVLGSSMFSDCTSLSDISLGDGLKSIGNSTFHNCKALEEITIPDSVETIDSYAFSGCSRLRTVVFPLNLVALNSYAFEKCQSLEVINFNGGEDIGGFDNCTSLREVNLPSTLKTLGSFKNCTALTEISIPDGVEYIYSFSGCTNLVSINIPSSVTHLGDFKDCTSLNTLAVNEGIEYIGSMENCPALNNITLPSTLKTIGDYAFRNCDVSHLSLPANIESIRSYAFYGATTAETIQIPNSIRYIGGYAFGYCTANEIIVPDTVSSVDDRAFYECKHITYNGSLEGSPWGAKSLN